jgi:hypothetical protein
MKEQFQLNEVKLSTRSEKNNTFIHKDINGPNPLLFLDTGGA